MRAKLHIIFAGGGTGGHLFPGIAIAQALQDLRPDCGVSFVGSGNRIEARVVPKLGYDFDPLWISGLKRTLSVGALLLPLKILVSLVQSWRILRKRQPALVVGTGGYASGPMLYLAAKTGRRTMIHEQNEYPGATTRMLSSMVDEVYVTFESSAKRLPAAEKLFVAGNPVRPSLQRCDTEDAREFFGLQPGRRTLFVFGGSLGSSSINLAVRQLVPRLVREGYQLLWQTGTRDIAELASIGALYNGQVVVKAFIDDMDKAYSAADLVVCRAGATSLAELSVLGHSRSARAVSLSRLRTISITMQVPWPNAGAALVLRDAELAYTRRTSCSACWTTMRPCARMAEASAFIGPTAGRIRHSQRRHCASQNPSKGA
jgi:UDP-N-acetylglucosamine--N-acetylmuramyl-(pentapeptide) pyrophosphoryl-undecaprenol N-acetylglucosamine transferase